MDKISAYIALLFLSAESDIELVQEEFYGDLFVQKSSTSEETAPSAETPVNGGNDRVYSDFSNQKNNEKKQTGGMRNNVVNTPPNKEAVIAS